MELTPVTQSPEPRYPDRRAYDRMMQLARSTAAGTLTAVVLTGIGLTPVRSFASDPIPTPPLRQHIGRTVGKTAPHKSSIPLHVTKNPIKAAQGKPVRQDAAPSGKLREQPRGHKKTKSKHVRRHARTWRKHEKKSIVQKVTTNTQIQVHKRPPGRLMGVLHAPTTGKLAGTHNHPSTIPTGDTTVQKP